MSNQITVGLLGEKFVFQTSPSLFSPKKFDPGSQLLLEHAILTETGTVLDYGCGWGAIGLIIAKTHPHLQVVMVDNNPEALRLTKVNISANGIQNVRVIPTSVLGNTIKYSAILTNPPWHKNKTVIPNLIQQAFDLLEPNGSFYMVIAKQFNTQKLLEKVFGNSTTIISDKSYKLLCSQKSKC